MKLVRFGEKGAEKPGLLHEGAIRDLSDIIDDIGGPAITPEGLEKIRSVSPSDLPVVSGQHRLGPCVTGVGKFMCIGLNYSDHAAESGMDVPPEPILFMKATSAITGPDDGIELPRGSVSTDWEIELGVVIGKPGRYIEEADAFSHVAGYCVINDVSERDFQIKRSGQWTKGKSQDTFGPVGPYLVTQDEVPDPQALEMLLTVNGQIMQKGSTRTMVYQVPYLVSYLSQFFTLETGDLIATGTPPGVGMGMRPPHYLKSGDVVELEIERLGRQRQTVFEYGATR
ncbi:MAG: fumarylacetoacetate hydrolase family protein [Pseudomonadota bacterium]